MVLLDRGLLPNNRVVLGERTLLQSRYGRGTRMEMSCQERGAQERETLLRYDSCSIGGIKVQKPWFTSLLSVLIYLPVLC